MTPIPFSKFSGCGNDFIIIDNRCRIIDEGRLVDFVTRVCARGMSVGADGLILVEPAENGADFKWRFFNRDGTNGEMCGNGARCAARFAHLIGIGNGNGRARFETDAGVISAAIDGERVAIGMPGAPDPRIDLPIRLTAGAATISHAHTGVPHAVMTLASPAAVDAADVVALGREIRHHPDFAPAGANVNFAAVGPDGAIYNRTYERGVEDETLACGTGSVAAALVLSLTHGVRPPVSVITRSGGRLTVHFARNNGMFTDIQLEGDARLIFRGELCPDAWNW